MNKPTDQVTALQATIADLQNQIKTLNDTIKSQQDTITGLNKTISELNIKLNSNTGLCNGYIGKIALLQNYVKILTTTDPKDSVSIAVLQDRVKREGPQWQ